MLFLGLKYDSRNQKLAKWDLAPVKKFLVSLHFARDYSSIGDETTIIFTTVASLQKSCKQKGYFLFKPQHRLISSKSKWHGPRQSQTEKKNNGFPLDIKKYNISRFQDLIDKMKSNKV